jgi:CheY-like chemotaxis protein
MNWCLVDERKDHREQFARLLRNHGVKVNEVQPGSSLEFIQDAATTAVGFILDYALHEQDPGIPYSGATLAAHIRQEYPNRPIVILSAFLRIPATNDKLRRTRDLIDLQVKKEEVEQLPERFARQLQALATGYERIRGILQEAREDSELAARSILGLMQEPTDKPALKEVVAYLAHQVESNDVALTARVLLHELLEFPGPLVIPEYAAVSLGINPQYSHDEILANHLQPARYLGAFQDLEWEEERQIPLYWRPFLPELKASLPNLPPALCFICRQAASTLCAECKRPIDGQHSLPAQRAEVTYPECRHARVCGNCLRKEELASGVILDRRHAMLRKEVVKESRKLLKNSQKLSES